MGGGKPLATAPTTLIAESPPDWTSTETSQMGCKFSSSLSQKSREPVSIELARLGKLTSKRGAIPKNHVQAGAITCIGTRQGLNPALSLAGLEPLNTRGGLRDGSD